MRSKPTAAESCLWGSLRNRKPSGYRFRRQRTVGRFIVDFYFAEAKLVVEVDGPVHKRRGERDCARYALLRSRGLRVLRFANERVMYGLDGVLRVVAGALSGEREEA